LPSGGRGAPALAGHQRRRSGVAANRSVLRRAARARPCAGGGGCRLMFDDVRAVADAVLFEGYALYPYRASAPKNQMRWQFGVVAPRGWSEGGRYNDRWWQETQCLIEPAGAGSAPRLTGQCRFLQLRRRDGDAASPAWDEGDVQEV